MARINVEEQIWTDSRFIRLCILLGNEETALGAIGFAWKYAQQYWCDKINPRRPIPEDVFNRIRSAPYLLEVGLARKEEDGVYIAGSEEHFQWYFDGIHQRSEAGKKSAERARDPKGHWLPRNSNETQRPLDGSPTKPNGVQPSSSSSSSSSFSKKKEEEEKPPQPPRETKTSEPISEIKNPPDPDPSPPSFVAPVCLLSSDPFVAEALWDIPIQKQKVWLDAYGKDRIWLEAEVKRCLTHWKINGSKKQGATLPWFLTNWLRDEKRKQDVAAALSPVPAFDTVKPPTRGVFQEANPNDFDEKGRFILKPPREAPSPQIPTLRLIPASEAK